jgi:hypothetical protein
VSGALFGATQISDAEPPQGAVYEIAPEQTQLAVNLIPAVN